jgi:thiamine pyrophosphokinase
MKHKKVAIVAGSDVDWVSTGDLKTYSYVIGVDRGAFVLLRKGIIPDIAIGDFDSVSKKELKEIRTSVANVKQYSPDKDQTDLELAVSYALAFHPEEITMFGVTGGRLDQALAALHLLRIIHEHKCRAVLRDEHNFMVFVSGKYQIQKQKHFSYLSILPFTDEITVSICGCKYPLKNHVMKRGVTLGVSNVIVSDHAEITVHKGVAYVILSRDGK